MLIIAARGEWGGGGAMNVHTTVHTQYGMIGGAIKFEKRSLDPIGKFDILVQG